MAEKSKGWLKGCAVGCGVLVLIPVLIVLVVGVRTCAPLRSANRDLARLEERFGPPDAYTPTADGAIPADRVQVFLEMRESMRGLCERMQGTWEQMRRVEQLDESETVTGREVAETTKGLAGASAEIAPFVGEFFEQRNRSLLEVQMGLGEYSYIFMMAYRDQLLDEAIHDELFSEGGPLAPEVQATLRTMLTHQLERLTADGGADDARQRFEDNRPRAAPGATRRSFLQINRRHRVGSEFSSRTDHRAVLRRSIAPSLRPTRTTRCRQRPVGLTTNDTGSPSAPK
jgi:hypothetical protein